MLTSFLYVALGGAIGATARFAMGMVLYRGGQGFPLGVISVNILGSFLMGVAVVVLAHKNLNHLTPLFLTGLLGGFTTFSAFSLEAYLLFERGAVGQAAMYVLVSVVASLAALVAGIYLMRGVLA